MLFSTFAIQASMQTLDLHFSQVKFEITENKDTEDCNKIQNKTFYVNKASKNTK